MNADGAPMRWSALSLWTSAVREARKYIRFFREICNQVDHGSLYIRWWSILDGGVRLPSGRAWERVAINLTTQCLGGWQSGKFELAAILILAAQYSSVSSDS
ncbi:hypothetical protein D3C80_1761520 [compost metagenome]